ncbi:hypothetical protein [Nitrospira sp. Kam-Ns4a]
MRAQVGRGRGGRARALFWSVALGLVVAGAPAGATDVKAPVRTVQGEIVAVNLEAAPPVLVAKTQTAKKQELIVGVVVQPDAVITRGKQRVALGDIKVGERVDLTYVRDANGLVAKAIHVR